MWVNGDKAQLPVGVTSYLDLVPAKRCLWCSLGRRLIEVRRSGWIVISTCGLSAIYSCLTRFAVSGGACWACWGSGLNAHGRGSTVYESDGECIYLCVVSTNLSAVVEYTHLL